MDGTQYQFADGMIADARRALWLPAERVLAVADLHLGYAWAHRANGQLLPVTPVEDTGGRLLALVREYRPPRLVVLGDVIHRAIQAAIVERVLGQLLGELSGLTEVVLIRGNHDGRLDSLVKNAGHALELRDELRVGRLRLVHGDQPVEIAGDTCVVMGHEHPSIRMDDGVATSVKCPCFLVGDRVVVLPAFSSWAAGSAVGRCAFLSPIAATADFKQALVIVGNRLLPLPWQPVGPAGFARPAR